VEEEEKVFHLCHHSKKLAVEFGLINTAPGTQLQIIKDQRICEDFHTSTKFISKILGRVIMVRDVNHFHHFEDGICSHMDYIVDASILYFVIFYIKSILFVACLVVFLHHQS
jgi:hypothetical protein